MKKLLFLSMAALLCFGCSKESEQTGLPDVAKHNTSVEMIDLQFSNLVDDVDFINNSYIEYIDENDQKQIYYPEEGLLTHFLTVKANSVLAVHANLRYRNVAEGTPIYCAVCRVEELGCDPVIFRDLTSNMAINTTVNIQAKRPLYAETGDPCQIYLWVEKEDFRPSLDTIPDGPHCSRHVEQE